MRHKYFRRRPCNRKTDRKHSSASLHTAIHNILLSIPHISLFLTTMEITKRLIAIAVLLVVSSPGVSAAERLRGGRGRHSSSSSSSESQASTRRRHESSMTSSQHQQQHSHNHVQHESSSSLSSSSSQLNSTTETAGSSSSNTTQNKNGKKKSNVELVLKPIPTYKVCPARVMLEFSISDTDGLEPMTCRCLGDVCTPV